MRRVLVVGSGAREHALAWRLGLEGVDVVVAPGNAGTPASVDIAAMDVNGLADFASRSAIDLTIVGPEAPLAEGLVDDFCARGLRAFGPTRAAAQLESSKGWTKAFLRRHAIPTSRADLVTSEAGARACIARTGLPVVLKADGLAGGKGVFVAVSEADVDEALETLFRRRTLGPAADVVLVEEFLEGPEVSVLAFSDGERVAVMPPARDYKRLGDGDRGPNTGGMGGYTRPSDASDALLEEIQRRVIEPTIAGMAREGQPYRGVLYAGLMLTAAGPRVLEFNCRFGDPEGQLILPLLESNLLEICDAVVDGRLNPADIRWRAGHTYGVVLAAPGYPDRPELGTPISGLDEVDRDVMVFHAGTANRDGQIVTAGGRVLTLVSGNRDAVYAAAEQISFTGKQFRRDIGPQPAGALVR